MLCDAHMLLQAVDNLINNAVAHSPAGSEVECKAACVGAAVVISVSEQAEQLTAEHIGRLFRPFASLGRPRSDGASSCGLGSWIVRLIAERHGGRIHVEPRSGGVGNVFSLTLPASGDRVESFPMRH